MPYTPGLEENGFLTMLQIRPSDLEFLADGCTKVGNRNMQKCLSCIAKSFSVLSHRRI